MSEEQRVQAWHESTARPLCVTLIALLQFSKAAFLVTIALIAWMNPAALRPRSLVSATVYIAAQSNPRGLLIAVVAVFIAAVAWGLFALKKWARNLMLLSTGMTVALWLRRFAFDAVLGDSTLQSDFQRQTVYIVIIIDALIFIYLWNVPGPFGEREAL